jgi:hypothetical protein
MEAFLSNYMYIVDSVRTVFSVRTLWPNMAN